MNEGKKVYFQVITYIMELVKKGELVYGGKIPSERDLMETLGLSRNSIREALRTLENMGIVESRHGRGNYLVNQMGKSLSSVFAMLLFLKESSYLEVSQLRRSMEIQAFYLAAERQEFLDRKKFQEIIEDMSQEDGELRRQADHQFHQMVIDSSGNRLLKLLMEALSEVCREEIGIILADATEEYQEIWQELHARIYRCLVKNDRENGRLAIMEHYDWIDRKLMEFGMAER